MPALFCHKPATQKMDVLFLDLSRARPTETIAQLTAAYLRFLRTRQPFKSNGISPAARPRIPDRSTKPGSGYIFLGMQMVHTNK